MRGLRSTIALVVVLAGLGAYIYFVTWKQPEGGADATRRSSRRSSPARSRQDRGDQGEVGGRRRDDAQEGRRRLAGRRSRSRRKADESEVSGITSALGQLEIVRVIDENPTDLNDYGLSNPRIEIDFKAAGDKDYRKLLIGDKTPTGAISSPSATTRSGSS